MNLYQVEGIYRMSITSVPLFNFLSIAIVIAIVIFLVMGIISLKKKKGKKSIKWFVFMTLFIISLFQLSVPTEVYEEYYSSKEGTVARESETSNQSVGSIKNKKNAISLKENSFDISLKTMQYNKDNNSLLAEYQTGLPDGTKVKIFLSPSHPDSWGKEYKPFYNYTKSLEQEVDTTVNDGMISYTFTDSDLNGLLLPNAVLYTTLTIPVNEQENAFIKEDIQTEADFNKRYPKFEKIQNENPNKSIYAFMENESGYDLRFYDIYEMKEAYTLEEILGTYEKEYIDYKQLEKNPNKYTGQFIKYQGQILQIMEDASSSVIRLAVTKDSYGYDYNDVVYVTYAGTTPFVEEDIVTVYGTVQGSHTYESQAGHQITLPHIEAEIIE